MAFELAASRVLAPTIGTSTYVWTSVIGVMIAALAAGYAAGGWMADRRSEKLDIIWILLMAAIAILVTCVFYSDILASITLVIHDPRLQGVIASIILFVPASFLLGITSPYLAKLRVHSTATTGRSVAGLSASNSVGGITGTFCTGFIFFTIIGSRETLALLAIILIICSWIIEPLLQRQQRTIATVALLLALMLQFVTPASAGSAINIDTPSAHYTIADITLHNKPVRVLAMGPGGWQSGVYLDNTGGLVFGYTRKLADAVAAAPSKNRILILGGGAFSLPEYLGRQYPDSTVDVVEIDSQLPAIAQKYFRYDQPSNVNVYTEDARAYLQKTTNKYDFIIADVYSDASVPFALTTREYTAELKKVLKPDGVVAVNMIASTSQACLPLFASLNSSYATSFKNSLYYPLVDPSLQTEQNVIAVYSNRPLSWAGQLPGNVPVQFTSARKLTDNHAPIEYLKQLCK